MDEDKICSCLEKHYDHLCVLRDKGMTKKIRQLTGKPDVACFTCGEEADSEDNVCSPVPLFI